MISIKLRYSTTNRFLSLIKSKFYAIPFLYSVIENIPEVK